MNKPKLLIGISRFKYKEGKVPKYVYVTQYDINHLHVKKAKAFLTGSLNPHGEIYTAFKIIYSALKNTAMENKKLYEEIEALRVENFKLKLGD